MEEQEIDVEADTNIAAVAPQTADDDQGPGKAYEIYLKNEELVDKLKLLNYEDGFLRLGGALKPIQRHYFVRSTNVGEQFFLFTSIAAWLIQKSGDDNYRMPQEFDDPNSTLSNIIGAAKNKGIPIDFTPNKLKSGSGEMCISILNSLADAALIQTEFQWKKMIPPREEDDDVNVDDDDDVVNNTDDNDDIEEDDNMFGGGGFSGDDDDDDENVIQIDLTAQGLSTESKTPLQSVLQSNTDQLMWKQEVDRVAPMLKITIRQDAKDWRLHLEQMNTMHNNVNQKVSEIQPILENMSKEMSQNLERIATREKTLNNQLSSMMSKFRSAQDKRAEMREKYKSASVGVSSRTATLDRISDDIEQLKQQIEEQGAKSNDGAPLVKIKQAVAKIEDDLQTMNVQIGVLENSILAAYLRDRYTFSTDMLSIY